MQGVYKGVPDTGCGNDDSLYIVTDGFTFNKGSGSGPVKMRESRIGRPLVVGETTIIPLESVSVYHKGEKSSFMCYITVEPLGIVISSLKGKSALDIYGHQVPLEVYFKKIEGLQQFIDDL